MGWATGATPDQNARTLGVGAYLGNTGFGYGDTYTVAYSEEVNQLFAQRIAAGSAVGDALVGAKQAYFGGRGVFGVYDEKAMARVHAVRPADVVGERPARRRRLRPRRCACRRGHDRVRREGVRDGGDRAGGCRRSRIRRPGSRPRRSTSIRSPTRRTRSRPASSGRAPNGVQVSHLRPLQPKLYVPLTGTTAHGALLTALRSTDEADVDPVYARPLLDLTTNEPELAFGDVAFPSRLQAVRTFETPSGRTQRVVVVTGQFFSNATPDPNGTGTQRLFSRVAGRVFKSTSQDYIPPAFQLIARRGSVPRAAFGVDVTDLIPTGPSTTGPGTVKRVLVAVRSGTVAGLDVRDLVAVAQRTPSTGRAACRSPARNSSTSSRPSTPPATSP